MHMDRLDIFAFNMDLTVGENIYTDTGFGICDNYEVQGHVENCSKELWYFSWFRLEKEAQNFWKGVNSGNIFDSMSEFKLKFERATKFAEEKGTKGEKL